MKIIVTGALGHIGSKLIRKLPEAFPGSEFVLIDNLLTQRYASLFNLPEAHYSFFDNDILTCNLDEVIGQADYVIHLAAMTDAASSFDKSETLFKNNQQSTQRIAKYCQENGIKLFFPSSTSVYGTQADQVDENCSDDELKPQSPYAECKLLEEAILMDLYKQGLNFVTARLGTIYGASPGMRFHTAVNKFCWQATLGQNITVWQTAYEQKRPYLELNDAVRAIIYIIDNDLFNGEIYNILTANHTVKDVIESIQVIYPDLTIEFVDAQIMNQLSYEVLHNKIANQGFHPQGSLQDGIKETLNWLNSLHKNKVA